MSAPGRSLSAFARATRFWRQSAGPSYRVGYGAISTPSLPSLGPFCINTVVQIRGAKTKVTISLDELPQGQLPALPAEVPATDTEDSDPLDVFPVVIRQHLQNVRKFKDCIVLTRVGNFYELYGEQAEQYAPLLNLKVAARKVKATGTIPMAGFQYQFLERYLKQLVVDLNRHVAISEEVSKPVDSHARGDQLLYDRVVSRIVTAGTLVDESFMDPYQNNYVLSVYIPGSIDSLESHLAASDTSVSDVNREAVAPLTVGLCWADLSSGHLYVQATTISSLSSVLARVNPREVVLDTALQAQDQDTLRELLGEGAFGIAYHESLQSSFESTVDWESLLDRPLTASALQMTTHEAGAAAVLLSYVKEKLQSLKITFLPPVRHVDSAHMQIDKQSLRGLEIRTTLRDNLMKGSLLHSIGRTLTKSGARLLTQRLVAPLMSIEDINLRLDLVATLLASDTLREDLAAILRPSADIQRLVQKFSIGRGDADDLLALARTIASVLQLRGLVTRALDALAVDGVDAPQEGAMRSAMAGLPVDDVLQVRDKIQNAIDEDGLARQHRIEDLESDEVVEFAAKVEQADEDEVLRPKQRRIAKKDANEEYQLEASDREIWIMKRQASATLNKQHGKLNRLMAEKISLSRRLREQLNCNSLTLKWTTQLGHYCHVKGKDAKSNLPNLRTISSSKNTRSVYIADWTELGRSIDDAKLRIRREEERVFRNLRDEVIAHLVKLRAIATTLDELDVAYSSATLAKERDLVRPIFHSGPQHHVIAGRHPMVDLGLMEAGRPFTSNDCEMSDVSNRILLITGPNMAGKSTYLRQTALISILAQTGAYVPAAYARLSIVDKVFSRIGSSDNLFKHQSTFMVEMLEVATILANATSRSLVVMDEVGRGTTPEDGTSVAFAVLKHLHDVNRCKTLFATHFHALADMAAVEGLHGVAFRCTDVVEAPDGSWMYIHRIREGINRDSHALKVAKLAGLPDEVLTCARRTKAGMRVDMTASTQVEFAAAAVAA